jgi:hypothetical protein
MVLSLAAPTCLSVGMQVVDRDEPSKGEGLPIRRRRRRALVAALAILIVVLLPAGVSSGVWVAHYQPLRALDLFTYSNAPSIQSELTNDAILWRYRPNATVVIGTVVKNTGRLTVTVTGYVAPTDPDGPIAATQLRASRNANIGGLWEDAPPVRRVSIHPGEEIALFVVMKMVPWSIGSDTAITESAPVLRVEVMGIHHLLQMSDAKIGVASAS